MCVRTNGTDLLNQCRLYASYAGSMASSVKEMPLIISMLFGQHKRLVALEKKLRFGYDDFDACLVG